MPETGAQTKDIFYYFIMSQWSILTSNSMAYALLESSLKKKKKSKGQRNYTTWPMSQD